MKHESCRTPVGLTRASTHLLKEDVDGRVKPGHDETRRRIQPGYNFAPNEARSSAG